MVYEITVRNRCPIIVAEQEDGITAGIAIIAIRCINRDCLRRAGYRRPTQYQVEEQKARAVIAFGHDILTVVQPGFTKEDALLEADFQARRFCELRRPSVLF